MTVQQKNNGTGEAANSSNATNHVAQTPDDHTEQKVILLPRKAYDPKTFWIGVLAKYFDIWVPTFPVHLKEEGSPYTFDFYSESDSKLVKIFTPEDEETIGAYLNLPYAKHILFIMDIDSDTVDLDCRYCGNCYNCNHIEDFAQNMGAHFCLRDGTHIHWILGESDDSDWAEVEPRR